jgi:iron complex transport system substrate-binding protein
VHRRPLALLVLLPLALAACGGSSAETASAQAQTRTVVHAAGTTEVPVDPQRIVTTTDQNALLPLLELGVEEVVGSVGGIGPTGEPIFRRTEGFDTTGVAHLGACCEVDVEAVAAQRPDLIVGYEFNDDVYDQLSAIAPTVLVQIFDRPLTEALLEFGDLAGERAQAEEQLAAYEARVASLRERLGPRLETLSVSVLTPGDPGTFFRGDDGQAVGTVMADVDPLRPAAQTGPVSEDAVSVERLADVDADVVLLLDFSGEERAGGDAAITSAPTWRQLRAVQAGQAHVVDATTTVGAAWARMGAFLDVLEEHLLSARDDVVVEQPAG